MTIIPVGQNEVLREIEVDLGRSMGLEELRYVEQEHLDYEIQMGILTTQAVANKINGVFTVSSGKIHNELCPLVFNDFCSIGVNSFLYFTFLWIYPHSVTLFPSRFVYSRVFLFFSAEGGVRRSLKNRM